MIVMAKKSMEFAELSSDEPLKPILPRSSSFSEQRRASMESHSSFIEIDGNKVFFPEICFGESFRVKCDKFLCQIPRDPYIRYQNYLHLPLSWMLNFAVYGINNTVSSLYIKVIKVVFDFLKNAAI